MWTNTQRTKAQMFVKRPKISQTFLRMNPDFGKREETVRACVIGWSAPMAKTPVMKTRTHHGDNPIEEGIETTISGSNTAREWKVDEERRTGHVSIEEVVLSEERSGVGEEKCC